MNANLGGRNTGFVDDALPVVGDEPTVVFGADVWNPQLGRGGQEFISGVVVSLDRHAVRFVSRVASQRVRSNKLHLPRLLYELFLDHYRYTRLKPLHVVSLRTVTDDGRKQNVVSAGMRALRVACRMLTPDYEPLVTFVLVYKTRHVRVFVPPGDHRDAHGRSVNPVSVSLLAEGALSDPQQIGFFLLSHSGVQGTSVTTRSVVADDEDCLGVSSIEKLVYCLIYSSSNCARALSVPVPIAYANLVVEHRLEKSKTQAQRR